MTETTIDPKDIRVGDRVTRSATVVNVGLKIVELKYDGLDLEYHIPLADLTAATITRPIDPDVLLVRRELVKVWPGLSGADIAHGIWDTSPFFQVALAAVKAVRAEVGK